MARAAHKLGNIAFLGVLAIVALFVLRSFLVTTAPTPPMFADGLSLERAVQRSAEKDGVVLAVVTADWCAPCQRYKRSALVDARVEAWIGEHGEAVYIDADEQKELAAQLGAQALPTTLLIHNGEPLGAISGAVGADALLAFLREGLTAAQTRAATAGAGDPDADS